MVANFADAYAALDAAGGALGCRPEELGEALVALFANAARLRAMARAAGDTVERRPGRSTARCVRSNAIATSAALRVKAPRFWMKRQRRRWRARALAPAGWVYGRATARRMARGAASAGGAGDLRRQFRRGRRRQDPAALALGQDADGRRPPRRLSVARLWRASARDRSVEVDPSLHNAASVGDEPLLLAALAPCFVGADRVQSARMAVEAGADALVLDDGLQNPSLAKDLAFAVVDGESLFGNGLCVPAGPLRAPMPTQAPLSRVADLGGEDRARRSVRRAVPGKPLFRAGFEPDALAAAPLIGREVVAFAGIARPEKFYATLRRVGARIVATRDFADHHRLHRARDRSAGRRGGAARRPAR